MASSGVSNLVNELIDGTLTVYGLLDTKDDVSVLGSLTVGENTDITGITTTLDQVRINNVTNQLRLGLGTTTTINSIAPITNKILTIPDPGENCNFSLGILPVVSLSVDENTNLTTADSGKIFLLQQATEDITISLPSPITPGLIFEFLVVDSSDGVHTQEISSTGANCIGNLLSLDTGVTKLSILAAFTTLTLSSTSANVKAGDRVKYISTGTHYIVQAISSGTASGWAES